MDFIGKIVSVFLLLFFAVSGITYGQWSVELSPATKVENSIGYPLYKWYPDGHISVLPDDKGYIMFWAEFESHRSTGTSQFVEDQIKLDPTNSVFGRRGNFNSWDNGGSWLMSVFRKIGDDFIGFYHAEDHWYPHTSNDIAWKSLAVTYSSDKGKTWSTGTQIITSPTAKPGTPTWGGSGDCSVVWDHINNRWMCYYQENWILMAISTDPMGAPGTWKKYYNGSFTEDGLGGQHTKLPGLSSASGGNPSVHWNTYLKKWVMVWHGWSPPRIYISVSEDGINWDEPKSIIVSSILGRAWYPTIIGNTDVEAGQIAKIYYADIANDFSYRNFETRTITFFDSNNTSPATAQIDQPFDNYTVSSPNEKVEIKASVFNLKAAIEKAEFYSDGELIGTDNSFPYQFNWPPDTTSATKSIKVIFTDIAGAKIESESITIKFDYYVGFNTYEKNDFIIYPNPVRDYVTLSGLPNGGKEICIYNMNQQLVYKGTSSELELMIDIKRYAAGIYFIQVRVGDQYYRNRIVKH
jgi:hypothetical protein